jgi:hypothetical protein
MKPVTRLVAAASLLAVAVSTAFADTWEPPHPRVFAAEGGRYGLKVVEPRFLGSSTGILFALDPDSKEKVIWSAKLVNVPHGVHVAPDGKRVVTIDTYGKLGHDHSLVVYDEKGKVLADYKLEDLLTDLEIQYRVSRSVSSRHWTRQATFAFSPDGKHFVITLKWPRGLPEELKGIKENLESVKDEAVRKRFQELIEKAESEVARRKDRDRVIKVDLASGKLEGGN